MQSHDHTVSRGLVMHDSRIDGCFWKDERTKHCGTLADPCPAWSMEMGGKWPRLRNIECPVAFQNIFAERAKSHTMVYIYIPWAGRFSASRENSSRKQSEEIGNVIVCMSEANYTDKRLMVSESANSRGTGLTNIGLIRLV
jgi:hypothetical protein